MYVNECSGYRHTQTVGDRRLELSSRHYTQSQQQNHLNELCLTMCHHINCQLQCIASYGIANRRPVSDCNIERNENDSCKTDPNFFFFFFEVHNKHKVKFVLRTQLFLISKACAFEYCAHTYVVHKKNSPVQNFYWLKATANRWTRNKGVSLLRMPFLGISYCVLIKGVSLYTQFFMPLRPHHVQRGVINQGQCCAHTHVIRNGHNNTIKEVQLISSYVVGNADCKEVSLSQGSPVLFLISQPRTSIYCMCGNHSASSALINQVYRLMSSSGACRASRVHSSQATITLAKSPYQRAPRAHTTI